MTLHYKKLFNQVNSTITEINPPIMWDLKIDLQQFVETKYDDDEMSGKFGHWNEIWSKFNEISNFKL